MECRLLENPSVADSVVLDVVLASVVAVVDPILGFVVDSAYLPDCCYLTFALNH